jgi:hypothetical protein
MILTHSGQLDHLEFEFSKTKEGRTAMKGTRDIEDQIIAILVT